MILFLLLYNIREKNSILSPQNEIHIKRNGPRDVFPGEEDYDVVSCGFWNVTLGGLVWSNTIVKCEPADYCDSERVSKEAEDVHEDGSSAFLTRDLR